MVSSRFRTIMTPYVEAIVKPIVRTGIDPGWLTVSGLGFSVFAAIMYSADKLFLAVIALAVSSIFDVADGAVARQSGRVTRFGGFLDSLTDRYSDSLIFIGIALFFRDHYILIMVALVGSLLVSYTRARAEMEIEKCDVGFGERAERLLIIIAATVAEALFPGVNALYWGLVLLAVITHLTVVQRIVFTYRKLAV